MAEIADYAKQPDDARVAVDYDLDVLVAASPVPSTPDDQRLPTALPGHTLVSKTAIQSRAVLAVSPSLQQDIRTIAEFAQKYQNNAAGVTVLVPPEFGVFNRALTDRGLAVSDQADQAAFDAALTQPGFTGGAIVPAGSKQGNLVSLEDPDNILPSRTLSVFAGDQVAKGDPEAERVLQEVTDALTPQVVDRLLTEVKNNGKKPADVARDWAGDNVPTSSGFPLAQMILALLLGGAAAFTALYLFGWRPPTTAVREEAIGRGDTRCAAVRCPAGHPRGRRSRAQADRRAPALEHHLGRCRACARRRPGQGHDGARRHGTGPHAQLPRRDPAGRVRRAAQ